MDKDQIILALQQENQQLRQEIEALWKRNLQDFMARAVRDDKLSIALAGNMAQFYPEPVTPWYVCILFFGGKPSRQDMPTTAPLDRVSDIFSETLELFGQPYFFECSGVVACLLNAELEEAPEEAPESGKAFCRALRDSLAQIYHESRRQTDVTHIAISHASNLEQGPRFLFRAAVSVAERRTSDSPAVSMEEGWVLPTREPINQVFSLEPLFWRQIQQRAFYDAATTLDQLIQLTSMEQGSLERTLASVFSRMEVVLQTAVRDDGEEALHDPAFSNLLPSLGEVETYQEMREVAYDILATLEDKFYTPPDTRNRKMANIEAYIARNYTDQLLCATSIADEFKISPSYLSRIFKADMGIGIVEYVHRIRTDAAKELLADEELTMDAIALKVGFSNRWVLTRVFKKLEGITPGAYRTNLLAKTAK